ncbi:hypothetical protein [Myceligenerans pegani]|uniref:Transporter n=1 Tax=Myceligenerans pegani TaxID=2776917 RepID=A0ABR9N2W0_9MICO|nr:hypothetical protein [Myceligenerans sp. TRM 65318]MBE1877981.1 hypothetical protein [Myceligenerans sp. TRM 65318]MBE3020252.1 hypothetical protein [Myceligenerans sp. TRM 65318]
MSADHGTPSGTSSGAEPGGDAFDAAARLRMIDDQQARTRSGLEPDSRLLYLAWGAAWLVGYLAMWLTSRDGGQPAAWAGWTLAAAIVAAMVFTMVHSIRRTAGMRGTSARAGAMYGWGWMLGFLTMWAILNGLIRAGAGDEMIAVAANGIACLIVGLMYLGGGMVFQDNGLYALGVWMLVTAAVATLVGLPGTNLVMALLGGGGFLAMGAVTAVVQARRQVGHD